MEGDLGQVNVLGTSGLAAPQEFLGSVSELAPVKFYCCRDEGGRRAAQATLGWGRGRPSFTKERLRETIRNRPESDPLVWQDANAEAFGAAFPVCLGAYRPGRSRGREGLKAGPPPWPSPARALPGRLPLRRNPQGHSLILRVVGLQSVDRVKKYKGSLLEI